MLRAVLDIAFLSVCPFVRQSLCLSLRLSDTRFYCVKTNEHRLMPFSIAGTATYLVWSDIRFINIFAKDHP